MPRETCPQGLSALASSGERQAGVAVAAFAFGHHLPSMVLALKGVCVGLCSLHDAHLWYGLSQEEENRHSVVRIIPDMHAGGMWAGESHGSPSGCCSGKSHTIKKSVIRVLL